MEAEAEAEAGSVGSFSEIFSAVWEAEAAGGMVAEVVMMEDLAGSAADLRAEAELAEISDR